MTGTVTPDSGRPALRSVPDTGSEPSIGAGGFHCLRRREVHSGCSRRPRPLDRPGNRGRDACVEHGVTEDELDRIAEVHFDGDPVALAQLRQDSEAAAVLDALDLTVWDLHFLRDRLLTCSDDMSLPPGQISDAGTITRQVAAADSAAMTPPATPRSQGPC